MPFENVIRQAVYEHQRGKDITLSYLEQGSRLGYAKSTVHHVRRTMPIRESNRESNVKRTGGLASEAVPFLRTERAALYQIVKMIAMDQLAEAEEQNSLHLDAFDLTACIQVACTAASGVLGGAGNCGEQSAAAAMHLIRDLKCPHMIERFKMDGGDHAFVVIDREQGSEEGDYTTWGDSAVVCDPWYNRAFLASKFKDELPFRKGTPKVSLALPVSVELRYVFVYVYELYLQVAQKVYRFAPHASLSALDVKDIDDFVKTHSWYVWDSFDEMLGDVIKDKVEQEIQDAQVMNEVVDKTQKLANVLVQVKEGTQLNGTLKKVLYQFCQDSLDLFYDAHTRAEDDEDEYVLGFIAIMTELLTRVSLSIDKSSAKRAVAGVQSHVKKGLELFDTLGGPLTTMDTSLIPKLLRLL